MSRTTAGVFAAAVHLCVFADAYACSSSLTTSTYLGSNINLIGTSPESADLLPGGIDYWNAGCTGIGTTFPTFTAGGGGSGPIYSVTILDHNETGICGSFAGTEITLWRTTFANGSTFDCGPLDANLAHEMGHVLGLADASASTACMNHIMAELQGDGSNRTSRSVQADECETADRNWTTETERDELDGGGGNCDVI